MHLLIAETTAAFEHWPHVPTLTRLLLALAIGLFIGLERERRGKEAGLRTFAFVALLGALAGLQGGAYGPLALSLVVVLVSFLNIQTVIERHETELTTSVALLLTCFVGILSGQGHTFTPVSAGIATAGLLAWKNPLTSFSLGVTESELRSAILLGILAFIVYPIIPEGSFGPWEMFEPRLAWVTVILIASVGFGNYVLLKLYGSRGMEVAGFLGGLVNSTVVVAELAQRVRESEGKLSEQAYRCVMLAVLAMLVRNGALVALLATATFPAVALSLSLMLTVTLILAVGQLRPRHLRGAPGPPLALTSPFALSTVAKFGAIFLVLQSSAVIAQHLLGGLGFYAVTLAGGFVSSSSAVASACSLAAHGDITPTVAGVGVVLASLASSVVNLPLVAQTARDSRLTRRLAWSLSLICTIGLSSAVLQHSLGDSTHWWR